jgi:hypothetical protein
MVEGVGLTPEAVVLARERVRERERDREREWDRERDSERERGCRAYR